MADTFIIFGIGIGLLVICVLGFAATKPGHFKVQRSIDIQAPPGAIFPLINDFRQWRDWSPFEKLDPDMKHRFSTQVRGKGAVYTWEGNARAGAGRMTITEVMPLFKIGIRLDFVRPFAARQTVVFSLLPLGDATKVVWDMQGPSPFIGRIMQVFVNLDKRIGKDFEAGLASMKALAENQDRQMTQGSDSTPRHVNEPTGDRVNGFPASFQRVTPLSNNENSRGFSQVL